MFGEAVFALPFIEAYQKEANETGCSGTRKLLSRFSRQGSKLGLDFKSFDETVPSWLLCVAFKILKQNTSKYSKNKAAGGSKTEAKALNEK